MITQEILKERFYYNPQFGIFIYKKNRVKAMTGKIAGRPSRGYLKIKNNGVRYMAHRLVWLYVHGCWPKYGIDHINGSPLDNRIKNLRDVTQGDNTRNAKRAKNNTSGCTGVWWWAARKVWMAEIKYSYKKIPLGAHANFFEACCARKSAQLKYGFHPNHGR